MFSGCLTWTDTTINKKLQKLVAKNDLVAVKSAEKVVKLSSLAFLLRKAWFLSHFVSLGRCFWHFGNPDLWESSSKNGDYRRVPSAICAELLLWTLDYTSHKASSVYDGSHYNGCKRTLLHTRKHNQDKHFSTTKEWREACWHKPNSLPPSRFADPEATR